jgi:hypothetical protein
MPYNTPEKRRAYEARTSVVAKRRARNKKYYQAHKAHLNEQSEIWRLTHPAEDRAWKRRYYLKRKFGITPEEYVTLLEAQNGLCALCGKPPSESLTDNRGRTKPPLCVDHDHDTGEIRGLLHYECNAALGLLGDSVEIVQMALEYLRDHKPRDGNR